MYLPGATSVPQVEQNTLVTGDSFYNEPKNISSYLPGEVIRMRKMLQTPLPQFTTAVYQYMVRSTDSLDKPVGIVSTIYKSARSKGNKLLSFQVPSDLASIDCAPSVSMLDSMLKLEAPLLHGWDILATDSEGLNAAFGAGKLGGYSVLDGIRGALVTGKITGIKADARTVICGYSGGSIATGWAAALQPRYAPDLNGILVGASIGGWVTNYTATIESNDGTITAGLVGAALSGLIAQYPKLKEVYKRYVTLSTMFETITQRAQNWCLLGELAHFFDVSFFMGDSPGFKKGALSDPTVKQILDENTVALRRDQGLPTCPIFLHHALSDTVAPINDIRRVIQNYRDWGIKSFEVNFVRDTGHVRESYSGYPAAVAWLKRILDGEPPVEGYVEKTWDTLYDYPGANHNPVSKREKANDQKSDVLRRALTHAEVMELDDESKAKFFRKHMVLP
ncbi:LIP-domain-containing protein [Metschnikowia bicuspidata var. bicuspidata NRRL YB-4993]|uniref:LIP-domain-containing protein n=1 Tax=Metschnikowia bicuspidata var. bicuspidata NRRL YB-4993 TaxID=869754 RepID=A0A1A0HEC6_9ASCO|nr:LIP-domain-containing protein [Metschnikowia bicuspidata var. bicuspidata NRRL YB-4993]OBA22346.1 LIP-domain-containing protein [Metschnikowia bicuspidata var. bicuspidata NRRL YB-4993]